MRLSDKLLDFNGRGIDCPDHGLFWDGELFLPRCGFHQPIWLLIFSSQDLLDVEEMEAIVLVADEMEIFFQSFCFHGELSLYLADDYLGVGPYFHLLCSQ